jgi:hypothetical protein
MMNHLSVRNLKKIKFDIERFKVWLAEIEELYEGRGGYLELDVSESPTGIVTFTDFYGSTSVVMVGRIED